MTPRAVPGHPCGPRPATARSPGTGRPRRSDPRPRPRPPAPSRRSGRAPAAGPGSTSVAAPRPAHHAAPRDRDVGEHRHVLADGRAHARQRPVTGTDSGSGSLRTAPCSSSQPRGPDQPPWGRRSREVRVRAPARSPRRSRARDECRSGRPAGRRPATAGWRAHPGRSAGSGSAGPFVRGRPHPGRPRGTSTPPAIPTCVGEVGLRRDRAPRPRRPARHGARAGPRRAARSSGARSGQRRRRRGRATVRPPPQGAVARRRPAPPVTCAATSRDRTAPRRARSASCSIDPSATTRPFTPSSTSSAGP